MPESPFRSRTRTRRRIILVVPEDAAPQVLSLAKEMKDLLSPVFVVRIETDEEVTPLETQLKEFPYVVKILG